MDDHNRHHWAAGSLASSLPHKRRPFSSRPHHSARRPQQVLRLLAGRFFEPCGSGPTWGDALVRGVAGRARIFSRPQAAPSGVGLAARGREAPSRGPNEIAKVKDQKSKMKRDKMRVSSERTSIQLGKEVRDRTHLRVEAASDERRIRGERKSWWT